VKIYSGHFTLKGKKDKLSLKQNRNVTQTQSFFCSTCSCWLRKRREKVYKGSYFYPFKRKIYVV